MKFTVTKTIFLFVMGIFSVAAQSAPQLHLGRYLGYFVTPLSDQKIAMTMDLFKVQPNDTTLFPQLNAILKINLGGLQSSEYVTQIYDDIRYDFIGASIALDSVDNDFVITASVAGDGQAILDGQILVRSSATMGTIHLVEYSDEPDAISGVLDPALYKPLLSGQYTGLCDGETAVLQIETAKELKSEMISHQGLVDYKIVGRLGMKGSTATVCAESESESEFSSSFCAVKNYTDGVFDFITNRLVLDATTNDECSVTASGIDCNVHTGEKNLKCTLSREKYPSASPIYYNKSLFLAPNAEQMAKLPDFSQPGNRELVAALGGNYTGFVHHEYTNQYQVMRLGVLASTSTNNPHNENLVYISGALALHFGDSISSEMFSQQFEARAFYLTDGFTLESPHADLFLQISDWRKGYVKGVLYSHAFGRVGSFELIKSNELPVLSGKAKFIPSVIGTFVGPFGRSSEPDGLWQVDLAAAPQNFQRESSTSPLTGNIELTGGITPRKSIKGGIYDFYTGAIAWEVNDGRVVTGRVGVANDSERWPQVSLFWPAAPQWGVVMDTNHNPFPFKFRGSP